MLRPKYFGGFVGREVGMKMEWQPANQVDEVSIDAACRLTIKNLTVIKNMH